MAPVGAVVGGLLGATATGQAALGATTALGGAALGAGAGSTVGSLLGGGGLAGPSQQQLDVQKIENLTEEQKLLLAEATDLAIEEVRKKTPKFGKETVVGPTRIQRDVFREVERDVLPQIRDTPARALAQFEEQVAEPARQQYLEETAPRLAARYNAANALSSSAFNRQVARQARELEEGLARQRSLVGFEAERQQLPQLISALGVGEAQRGISQAQRSGELQKFISEEVAPPPALALVGNPLGVQAYQNLALAPQPNPVNPLLGVLSQQAFGGLFGGGAASGGGAVSPQPIRSQFPSFGYGGIV